MDNIKKETKTAAWIGREQRRFPRTKLSCRIVLHNSERRELAQSCTDNISNAGCYLTVPHTTNLDEKHLKINLSHHVELGIPRQTSNTYMIETCRAHAKIVRIDKLSSNHQPETGIALQFAEPLELQLDNE